jgi:hypothetical protein
MKQNRSLKYEFHFWIVRQVAPVLYKKDQSIAFGSFCL